MSEGHEQILAMGKFHNNQELIEYLREKGVEEDRIPHMMSELACLTACGMEVDVYLRISGYGKGSKK